jgi:hypothetical protein
MMNFTKSGNHNSSFTATAIWRMTRLQRGEDIDDENVLCSDSEDWDDDPQGVGEQGFAHFTRSLPVIYLRQWLNEKPEHTNFCSKQIPPGTQFDSLSSIAVGAMATPAAAARATSQKKTSSTKAKNKDILVKLVAELKDRHGESLFALALLSLQILRR